MRLIDADALMDLVQKTHCTGCNNYNKVKCRACEIGDMLDYLDDAPTVDLWKYPSRGELPDDNEIVLLRIKGKVWKKMEFGQWNGMFFVANDSDYSTKEILAWQYIEPPKEEA